jgi:Fur family transcriptional regulator, ferric uptake regulator
MATHAHTHADAEALCREWAANARETLRAAGYNRGAARDNVIGAISAQTCALSATDIEEGLRRDQQSGRPISTASVYRTLELLHEHTLVNRVDLGDGVARYELVDPRGEHHHHHMVCDRCGQLIPFDDPALERSINQLSSRLGFATRDHEVTLRGNCADCCS